MKNLMKKLLSKIGIAMMAVLPLASVGTAFSLWYFGETQPVTKKADTKDYIDDVEPNYKFSVNLYDVYFFPNRGYADLVYTSIARAGLTERDDMVAVLDTYTATAAQTYYNGYYSTYNVNKSNASTAGTEFFGYWDGETGDAKYAYKHIAVETALAQAQFESIGQPKTNATDHNNWPTSFAGWTCDLVNARSWSFASYGDFEYAKLFEPLRTINETAGASTLGTGRSIDGSYKGNKVVFVYPVFSAGGTTYAPDSITSKTVMRIHGDSTYTNAASGRSYYEEYYMSRSGTSENNKSIYTYHNLLIKSDSVYYLDFARLNVSSESFGSGTGDWRNYQIGTNVSPVASVNTPGTDGFLSMNALFIGSESAKQNDSGVEYFSDGLYNVYAYIHYGTYPSSYSSNVSSDYDGITTANTTLKLCQNYSTSSSASRVRFNTSSSSRYNVDVYLKIEKIDSFHLGGISSPMTTDAPALIRYDSGSYTSGSATMPYVDFQLNNLFIDGDRSKGLRRFPNADGNLYGFQSTVFTVVSDVFDFDDVNIRSLSVSDVATYNTKAEAMYPITHKDFYASDTLQSVKKVFDGGTNGTAVSNDYFENKSNFPFDTFKQNNFFRVTPLYSNYYDILVRVYYNTSAQVVELGVAVAPHDNDHLDIWIYDGSKITANQLACNDDGFINNKTDSTNPNYQYLIGIVTLSEGGELKTDTSVTSYNNYITSTTSPTVADYLGTDKYFQDHLTGLSLDVGETIAKNYVVLLQSKTA